MGSDLSGQCPFKNVFFYVCLPLYVLRFILFFFDCVLLQEEEYSKLRESNRQLVAIAKGLAGALLVVGVGLLIQ